MIETTDAILGLVRQTDPVRAMLAEAADRTAADRQALVEELAKVEREADAEIPRLAAELVKAADRVRQAQDRLNLATQALGAAASAKLSASVGFDLRRDKLRQALRAGADNAAIDLLRTWLHDQHDAATREPIETMTVGAARNEITGRKSSARVVTNKASIDARLAAIRTALAGLDDLRLVADQRHVAARIAEVKASLPRVEPPRVPQGDAQ